MSKGTYTLLVELSEPATIAFGAAGERDLRVGWYAYTGSAFGTGGFSRVERHRELAAGKRDARHWHVDYLLGHPESRIASVQTSEGVDVECEVSQIIDAKPITGLGASDCDCDSHLKFVGRREELEQEIERAHASCRN